MFLDHRAIFANHRVIISDSRVIFSNRLVIFANHRLIFSDNMVIFANESVISADSGNIFANNRVLFANCRVLFANTRVIIGCHRFIFADHRVKFPDFIVYMCQKYYASARKFPQHVFFHNFCIGSPRSHIMWCLLKIFLSLSIWGQCSCFLDFFPEFRYNYSDTYSKMSGITILIPILKKYSGIRMVIPGIQKENWDLSRQGSKKHFFPNFLIGIVVLY